MTELTVLNGDDKYEVEAIRDSAVYARESELGQLPRLYYLVFWKGYPEEENTWELIAAVQHLRKLINLFYKNHLDKPTATFEAINIAPPMARPITQPTATGSPKRKRDRPANMKGKKDRPAKSNKRAKTN